MAIPGKTLKKWALGALALLFVGAITALGAQGSLLRGWFDTAPTPAIITIQIENEYGTGIAGMTDSNFSVKLGSSAGTITSVTPWSTDGIYTIVLSDTGPYVINIQKSGYISQVVSITASSTSTNSTSVTLISSSRYIGKIQINDQDGAPITGLSSSDFLEGSSALTMTNSYTDSNSGRYTLAFSAEGSHTITIQPAGYVSQDVTQSITGSSYTLTAADTIALVSTATYSESIQINDQDGMPITTLSSSDFSVSEAAPGTLTGSTNVLGLYTLTFSVGGSYDITIQPTGYVSQTTTITVDNTTSTTSITLDYSTTVTVTDSITNVEVSDATVEVTALGKDSVTCIEFTSTPGTYGCPASKSPYVMNYSIAKTGFTTNTGTTSTPRTENSADPIDVNATLSYKVGVTMTTNHSDSDIARVTEGGASDTYNVALSSAPTAEVTLSLSSTSVVSGEISISPNTLTFTADNWSTTQPIEISALEDSIALVPHFGYITNTASSTDPHYTFTNDNINPVDITDDDTAGVIIAESDGSINVTEGGTTDTYTVVLSSQPSEDVTITATPDSQITVSPNAVVFTAVDWNIPQSITVSAVNDGTVEGTHSGTITHIASSSDNDYASLHGIFAYDGISVDSVTANITDYSTNTVTITQTDGSTAITEGGATDTYSVVLAGGAPTGTVTITATPNSQETVSPSTLTFTSTTWNTPQNVTVTAVSDGVTEGTHSGSITHAITSTADTTNYPSTLSIAGVTPTITDYVVPVSYGATVTQSSGSTSVTEGGATDSFTVVLTGAPTADVSFTVSGDSQVSVTPTSLTFTSSTWATPQTVTVSAILDSTTETSQTGTVKLTVSSVDSHYNAISISNITVTVTDATVIADVTIDESCSGMPFTDVASTDWFCEYVYQLYHKNVVQGTDSTHFSPNSQITRAEVLKMIDILILGNPAPSGSIGFIDVSTINWYYNYAISAKNANVARLTDDNNHLYGDLPATRAWAARAICRAKNWTSWDYEDYFSDVSHSYFAAYAISILHDKMISDPYDDESGKVAVVEGYSDGTFGPDNAIARSEFADMLYRADLAD